MPVIICFVSGTLCSSTDVLSKILNFFANAERHLILLLHTGLAAFYIFISIIPEYIMLVFSVVSQ